MQEIKPDEIYNLAAQSHVKVSFEEPEYTANSDALGTLRLLEAIRIAGLEKTDTVLPGIDVRAVRSGAGDSAERNHALLSSVSLCCSEALCLLDYGELSRSLWNFCLQRHLVQSRIAQARRNLRHPQDHPGTRRIKVGLQETLFLGNLDALRDWGHARDYVEMQWRMLQQDEPKDYVIATGEQHSVRDFVDLAARFLGMEITWDGQGRRRTRARQRRKRRRRRRSTLLSPH